MKGKKLLFGIVIVLLAGVLAFAAFRVVSILTERNDRQQFDLQLHRQVVREKPVPQPQPVQEAQTEAPEQETPVQEEAQQPEPEPIYIPISVDFEPLLQQNKDVRGWIYCPDTPISYPVLQGSDNRYYLRHRLDGSYDQAGSVFLDHRCAGDLSGMYTLIHGHNLKDSSLFGTLPNYSDQAYFQAHPVVYLLTPAGDHAVELFAGFTAEHDDQIYSIPATKQHRMDMVENCIARSDFVSQIRPSEEDQLIILSTCSYAYDDARYVVIGVLRGN